VPFTLRNFKEDLEDVGSRFDGAPDLEFRLATEALELEQSGLSYQRVPPGYRFPYGHTHKKQEETVHMAIPLSPPHEKWRTIDATRYPRLWGHQPRAPAGALG
jgi:hypothetical protein